MTKKITQAAAFLLATSLTVSTHVYAANSKNNTVAPTAPAQAEAVEDVFLYEFNGVWKGAFPVYTSDTEYFIEPVVMDINSSRSQPILLQIYSIDEDCYLPPDYWYIEGDMLYFIFYEGSWRARAGIKLTSAYTIEGTYDQRRKETNIQFELVSKRPAAEGQIQTDFVFEGKTDKEWQSLLKKYPAFTAGGTKIPFSYELGRWDKSYDLVERYGLVEVLDRPSDVEQMKAVLDIMSRNFEHNGTVALGNKMDPASVIAQHDRNGGIECRGLSIILSEMLRDVGIPAKPVMCISAFEPAECHVVVHAYSKSQGQWIMLDPTYHLMLENAQGQYVSLPMLREALISGEPLFANAEAGYNQFPFSMDYYRAYMSKNMFRFASATKFYYGGEQFADTDVKASGSAYYNKNNAANPLYMLVPVGYEVPYHYSRSERVTTDAEAFWAAP